MDMLGFQDEFDCLSKLDIDNTPHLQVRLQALSIKQKAFQPYLAILTRKTSELHAIRFGKHQ